MSRRIGLVAIADSERAAIAAEVLRAVGLEPLLSVPNDTAVAAVLGGAAALAVCGDDRVGIPLNATLRGLPRSPPIVTVVAAGDDLTAPAFGPRLQAAVLWALGADDPAEERDDAIAPRLRASSPGELPVAAMIVAGDGRVLAANRIAEASGCGRGAALPDLRALPPTPLATAEARAWHDRILRDLAGEPGAGLRAFVMHLSLLGDGTALATGSEIDAAARVVAPEPAAEAHTVRLARRLGARLARPDTDAGHARDVALLGAVLGGETESLEHGDFGLAIGGWIGDARRLAVSCTIACEIAPGETAIVADLGMLRGAFLRLVERAGDAIRAAASAEDGVDHVIRIALDRSSDRRGAPWCG